MKRFKQLLGVALALSLVITQFPGIGKEKQAEAAGELVEVVTSEKGTETSTIIPETVADSDYNIARITLQCAEGVNFADWDFLKVVVTVNETTTTYTQVGIGGYTDNWSGTFDIRLTKPDIKKGDTYKIEAYTPTDNAGSWAYKVGITLAYSDEEYPKPGMIYSGVEKEILPDSPALKAFDSMTVNVQSASDTNFNEWVTMTFTVTVNGESMKKEIKGDTYQQGITTSYEVDGLNIQEGDIVNIKVIAYYDGAVDYIYIVTIQDIDELVSVTENENPEETEAPGQPPVSKAEVFTGKRSTIIPETVADSNYNVARITLEAASGKFFADWDFLKVVVTVNGTETTYTQVGIGGYGSPGWSGTFDIRLTKPSIKKGDTYKVEAYAETESSETWVYLVGAALAYSDEEYPRPGMIYSGVEKEILSNSRALKAFDTMTVNVKSASDTSFNEWVTMTFTVTVNGVSKKINVEGDTYQQGITTSYDLEDLNIKEGDLVSITAIAYYDGAVDYIFEVTIPDIGELVEPSSDSMPPSIVAPTVSSAPGETTAPSDEPSEKPSEDPTGEPTDEPGTEPTSVPSDEPGIEPSAEPGTEPSTEPSTAPTKQPDVQKGDKVTSSGLEFTVTSTTSNTVKYTDAKNDKKSSVKIPKTVKATVDGKATTFKVTGIAKNAFKGNKSVKKITISKNIKTIGEGAFKNCSNLKTIVINSSNITKVGKNAFKGTSNKLVVKVPAKKVSAYQKLFKGKGNNNLVVKAI